MDILFDVYYENSIRNALKEEIVILVNYSSKILLAHLFFFFFFFFLSTWVFFYEHSWFIGQQGMGEGIYITLLYHFHPLHRHLDISRAITTESSPVHIGSSRTHIKQWGVFLSNGNYKGELILFLVSQWERQIRSLEAQSYILFLMNNTFL